MRKLLTFFLLAFGTTAAAQHPRGWSWDGFTGLYLTVDPATGNVTVVDTVPAGLTVIQSESSFISVNNRFSFIGWEPNSVLRLYTLDTTGAVVFSPQLPINVAAPHYNWANNNVYGLGQVPTGEQCLVILDPATAQYTVIDTLPSVSCYMGTSTLDPVNGHFIFTGADSTGQHRLFSIDLQTGGTVYDPAFSEYLYSVEFSCADTTVYALWEDTTGLWNVVSVDPVTANMTLVMPLPGLDYSFLSSATIDQQQHYYFFKGIDANGDTRIYTVDLQTGTLLSSPLTDPFMQDLQLPADCQQKAIGIAENEVTSPPLYPNPASDVLHLPVQGRVHVYNALGQEAMNVESSGATISVAALPPGLYRVVVETAKGLSGASFIKE